MTAATAQNPLASVAALTLPDTAALTTRAQGALEFIESFAIVDQQSYELAAEELQAIKARSKRLEEQRTGITGPINTALKAINALFGGPKDLLDSAEAALKRKMLAYKNEQDRIAAEERRKAEEVASAERRRLETEAAQRQAEAKAQAEAAAAAQAAGDMQAAALAAAAAQRAQAEANVAATTAQVVVAAPVVAVAKPAAKGISTSTKVDFEVTDLRELVKHIAEHPELLSLVVADSVRLRAYVRGLGLACKLPGVRVFETSTMAARAA